MASLLESIRNVQSGEIEEAVKFNGRTFKNTKSFNDDDSANAFMQKNKDWGVVGTKGGKVFLAPMKDMGEGFEPELEAIEEAKKQNGDEKMDRVDRDELKKGYEDREDKDIDNDGDHDDSDEYLHKRRKAISKALAKEEVDLEEQRRRAPKMKDDPIKVQREKDKKALPYGSKYKTTRNRATTSTERSLADIRKRAEKRA